MRRLLVLTLFTLLPVLAFGIDTERAFEDPELQARYEKLIAEVRCLKCQNQSIKDSNAFLAGDLRREIRRMLLEGKTDEQIFDFLVLRYGDFALYRPRMQGATLLLYIGPIVFFLLGGLLFVRILKSRTALPIDDDADEGAGSR